MQLEMFVYAVEKEYVGNLKLDIPLPTNAKKIANWNEYNPLHGFFVDLYHKKGGQGQFHDTNVIVNLKDLDKLEFSIIYDDRLSPYEFVWEYFFHGYPDNEKHMVLDLLKFVQLAREKINEGYVILFSSEWWI